MNLPGLQQQLVTMQSGFCASTVKSLLVLISCFVAVAALVTKEIDENKDKGYIVHTFPSPSVGEVYTFFQATDTELANALKLFQISTSGVVKTTKPIFFEIGKSNTYDLVALQRPPGATEGGVATTLRVKIKDTNNFSPTFPADIYYGQVKEQSSENVIVQGIEDCFAEDRDESGMSEFKISSGNDEGYFKAEKKIVGDRVFLILKTTATKIKRKDATPNIVLTVRAEDGIRYGETKVQIKILDFNDNAPKFEKSQYSVKVAENTPLMTSVFRVRATDEDVGANGGIYYYLSTLSDYFSVDAITGVIKVVQELNYQAKSSHSLTVKAQDRGTPSKSSTTRVDIQIDGDLPNFPRPASSNPGANTRPFFPDGPYSANVREDLPVKGALLVIHALDRDPPGSNSRLTYRITSGASGKFEINSKSGVVSLTNTLDFEAVSNPSYTLTIEVKDGAGERETTKLTIEMQDVDENRNAPAFTSGQQITSVAENQPAGSRVIKVVANDQDQGDDGKVVYSAVKGSGLRFFEVDQTTGIVKTAAQLDREETSLYELMIEARDKATFPLVSHLYLMIKVSNADDYTPDFSKAMYEAKVPEKADKNTFVTVVHAVDKDGPSFTYEFSGGSAFNIERQTGVIRTARQLDPSNGETNFILQVSARNNRESNALVNVTVTSRKDSPPTFKQGSYKVSVPENQGRVDSLLCVAAVGPLGRPAQYSIGAPSDGRFTVTKNSGKFGTTSSFDYESVAEGKFTMEVRATTDKSQQAAFVNVEVTIEDTRDSPTFEKAKFEIDVPEDSGSGTTLSSGLRIVDQDTSKDNFICSLEKITSLDVVDTFKVNNNDGVCELVTQANLDHYKTPQFSFEVRATDKSYRNMYASADVVVKVTDTNTYAPEFLQSSYSVSVPSTVQKGSKILTVKAVDKDAGTNGDFVYQLIQSQDSQRFDLSNNNGQLNSASALAADNKYQLQIKASDKRGKSNVVNVNVYVYGPSANPLRFSQDSYSKEISEDANVNADVLTVKATPQGSISYLIVGGNAENAFKINPSGQIQVARKVLDRERIPEYKLAIRASKSGGQDLPTEVIVTVTLKDVNDNAPRFAILESPKEVSVDSFSTVGTKVLEVKALDKDAGSFGIVTYDIDKASSDPTDVPFSIGSKSGLLEVSKVIPSKASRALYKVIVKATDGGGKSSTTEVRVIVNDVKPPPTFSQNSFDVTVPENGKVGDTVKNVQATYDDKNALLKYKIVRGNNEGTFCINRNGLITIARPLDREKTSDYVLQVEVQHGNSKGSTTVNVKITDINDDTPHFSKPIYTFAVNEGGSAPREVGTVSATDMDTGTNGEISYKILYSVDSRSFPDLFDITTKNKVGVISLKRRLDYERIKQHVLYVRAIDGGSIALREIVKVIINVKDDNDNEPRFSAQSYSAKVSLDAKVDNNILQVTATDLDSGVNGEVQYSITSGNGEGAFKINPSNGVISLKKSLTTVSASQFEISVLATDKGKGRKNGTASVEVSVFLPDGPPKFVESPVIAEVEEGVLVNQRVLVVKAATSEALTYEIVSGNEDGMFRMVHSTGEILATRTLDYEEKKQHRVEVRAMDTRDRSAQVTVIINVKNINDNPPIFPGQIDNLVERKVEGKFLVGDPVSRLTAFDKDGEKITYKILSPSSTNTYFRVDDDGFLRSKRSIEGLKSPYEFRMEATDSGNPPKATIVNVRLIFVNYRPDQQPVRVDVLESEDVGNKIATVPRYFPGGTLSLIYPHKANFSVDNEGKLHMNGPLDYEKQKFYSLTIREKEPTAPFRNNDVDIEINVIDVNDNKPVFTMPDLFGRVNSNARPGTSAYQLRATDEDDGSNGFVGYQLVTHNSVFAINPFRKTVETGNLLENDGSYKVELFAFDYGIPHQRSDKISVEIKTVKFPPRFSKNLYEFEVSEAAFGGKLVGQVNATSSSNARLWYSIVQGDTNNQFRTGKGGKIFVNYFLDHEQQSLYNLKVKATEQIPNGYSSETDVRIKVINANDHYPKFKQSVYTKSVPESDTGSVLTVKAGDCDCNACECVNGLLKYSLSGTEFFKVDADTGDISVAKPLDFERQTVHVFKVLVKDFGEKKTYTALAYVKIEVQNVNDNEPSFAEAEYRTGISENADIGKSLAAVLATDADGDQLSYSITSGGGDIFKIDPNAGVISLQKKLPSSSQIQYTLQVRASDPEKKYQEVRLVVEVEDSNNNAPVFTSCQTAKVAENLPADKKVTRVVAEDKNDRGRNKEIEYSLKRGGERLFRIDNATGEIFTVSSLDREQSKSHSLTVQAEDGGHGRNEAERLLSYCFLKIQVEDKNDNYPEFLSREYLGSVYSKSPVGTTVLTVSATDADDDANSQVDYSFVEVSDLFSIDSDGVVKTKADLSNKQQTTRLTVRAVNRKAMETRQQETRNSKTTIEIQITDKKPPKCDKALFSFSIGEDKQVDEKVGKVSATSDTNSKSIAYSLVKDNTDVERAFQVRPDGEIRTGSQLNYERIKQYTLQIRAKETVTNLYSTCVARVTLDDINDEAPNFQLSEYYARVPENAGSGFTVVTVKANDNDEDGKAKVFYGIDKTTTQFKDDYRFFAIGRDSGVITTTASFNREAKQQYDIIVIADDTKTKPKVRVQIRVVDVNDVAPEFTQKEFQAKVSEDAAVGASITQLSAKDGDIGENARLDYFVSAGTGLQKFKMDTVYGKRNYGVLMLDGSLDYEDVKEYTIYVTATDRKDSSRAKVTIKVLDANDNTPEFQQLIYETTIPEESGAGVSVVTVKATDKDSATIQNPLRYSLDANGKKHFKINEISGKIETSGGKLDRERLPYFLFSVYAFDGKHRGEAKVRVKLNDINDNPPVFPSRPYVGYVFERKPKGTSVMVVQAIDKDEGINSDLQYVLVDNPGGNFAIDYRGLITTTKMLDRETKPNEFTVTVKATDRGSPTTLSGTTDAKIIVDDTNDNNPRFTKAEYTGRVAEDALPGVSVTEVSATDDDIGVNAELEFSITKGNDPSAFYLDPRTGKIYVSGLLDYDKGKRKYELTVIVRDRGLVPLQADKSAKVVITIGDANDNPPRFVPSIYNLRVSEGIPVGETLLKVTAVDEDSGSFAAFNFSISKGDESDIFGIRPSSKNASIGEIYTLLELDRETAPLQNLTIVATDLAGLTGTAMVYLTITDVNDNGPWFVPPYYEAEIKENLDVKQFVATINATDPDESSDGLPFTFSIVNVTGKFSISKDTDATAKILSDGSFDREAKPRWTLKVKGIDSGSPKRSNETFVFVKIGDENDNEPFDGELRIIVNAYRGEFAGGVIGKAYYKDDDSDGDVNNYKITSQSGSYFTIDSNSGDISAKKGIPLGSYNLKVEVTEQNRRSGSNTGKTVTSEIKVFVRAIPDAAVRKSVALQFLHVRKVSFFVGDFYSKVLSALAEMFGVSTDRVLIFSIQKAPLRHLPAGAFTAVEIQLAVEIVQNELYMTFSDVVKTIVQQKNQLTKLGLVVGDIGIDECAREYQEVGKCENVVKTSSKFAVASGDFGQIPAPGSSLTIVSMDIVLRGEYSAIFPPEYNCSTNNPCLHGGTCHTAVPRGIICECLRGFTGPHCEWSTRTFYGNSYIWLAALTAYERSEVSMSFITKEANGLLLYQGPLYQGANNGLGDFMAVMMVGGYIQLKMSLGPHPSAPLVMYMDRGSRLDDGNWHIVQVSRQLKVVKIIIDRCEKAQVVTENGQVFEDRRMCEMEAEVWGSSVYLNGFGPLQIGGVQNEVSGFSLQYTGFTGCIRDIYDNGDMYDLYNPVKVENSPRGCELTRSCPDCNNRGYCEPRWNTDSICVCDLGFTGLNCDDRSQANWYKPGSFSQYKVKQSRRKRRELVPPPVSLTNGFYSNIALQVKVDPSPEEAVIFLASNSLGTEFNRIDVKNGVLRYIFRLGDRMKILKIPEFNMTDGKYHNVVIKREGNTASMQIDYHGKVRGTTGGIHKLLNMGGGSFFAGGMPNITEVRIVDAWVKSGGNAILRGADGSVVSSGLGAGASGVLAGSTFVGTMIQLNSMGEVLTSSYSSTKHVTLSGFVAVRTSYNRIIIGPGGMSSGTGLGSQGSVIVRNVQITSSSSGGDGSSVGGGGSSGGGGSAGSSAGGGGSSGGGTVTGGGGGLAGGSSSGGGSTGVGGSGAYGGPQLGVRNYGAGEIPMLIGTQAGAAAGGSADKTIHVFGDFGGCTAENRYNGADLENDPNIIVERQNVEFGCPCETGFCLHGGTCVNAIIPYCVCAPGWTGPRCEDVVTAPVPGTRGTRVLNPAVIAIMLVVLLAIIFIVAAALLKRRKPAVVVVTEDGHVHDNVRPYHDEGAGEEDNFGYDIHQLMKYTYIESGNRDLKAVTEQKPPYPRSGNGEEEITVAENKPLLHGAVADTGTHSSTFSNRRTRPRNPESVDVGTFIDTRVSEADQEYVLSVDELHVYRYEGDDSDVDDLSELGSDDEDQEDEPDFAFLGNMGRKFDTLNRIFNEED